MNEEIVTVILNYMEENLFEPKSNWSKREFDCRSYSRWAVNEILERIMDHPFDSVIPLIENFFLQMAYYWNIAKNETAHLAFSTAMDTAEDIILLLV